MARVFQRWPPPLPDAAGRGLGNDIHIVFGVLDNDLAPTVDEVRIGPTRVEPLHVQIEVLARELQQMEQKQRHVAADLSAHKSPLLGKAFVARYTFAAKSMAFGHATRSVYDRTATLTSF